MPKKGGNISLSSYDDIFSTEESREAAAREQVRQIPLSELHPFEGHPFRVVDDEAMLWWRNYGRRTLSPSARKVRAISSMAFRLG